MANYAYQYLPCYTVGPDAYDRVPEVCGRFGKKAVAVGGHRALEAAKPYIEKAKQELGFSDKIIYGDLLRFYNDGNKSDKSNP